MAESAHSERPLLAVAAALMAGAWLGAGLPAGAAAVPLGFASLGLAAALVGGSGPLVVAGLIAAAVALGAAARSVEEAAYERAPLRRLVDEGAPDAPVRVEGRLAEDSMRSGDRCLLIVDVERVFARGQAVRAEGRARIAVADPRAVLEIAQGQHVTLWASLRPPRGHASPGAFDVAASARRHGIHAFGYCKSPALLRSDTGESGGPGASIARARRAARRVLLARLPPGEEAGLVRAMVLGDRTGVSEQTSEAFRIAGTYHVLALSGAQVALVAGLLHAGLRILRAPPAAAWLAAGTGVWVYAVFVGGDPPVTRAALMASCVAFGKTLDLDADLQNLLALAAGALAVVAPSVVGDPSFQLSFGATLGILVLAPRALPLVPRLPFGAHWVIAGSIAAQLALQPLLAAHFHRLAPAALLLNLAAGPLSSGVMLGGFAVLVAHAAVPALADAAALLSFGLARALLRSSDLAVASPWLDVRVPTPGVLAVLVYGVGLAWLAKGLRGRGIAVLGAATAWLALGPGVPADGRLVLSVLDVGQGDALVIRSPGGRLLVVDAGPAAPGFDAGETIVAPYLWSLGARRIDRLALTHSDRDHVGGARAVAEAFAAGEIWQGPIAAGIRNARGLEWLSSSAARRLAPRRAGRLAWDDISIECLGPPPPPAGTVVKNANDLSLVLRLRYRSVSFLLTGDVQESGELRLAVLPTDVLKVAHHGSRGSTSQDFLARVRPRLAVVSVGVASPFGHPSPETIGRLERGGALVLRTDRDGTVEVATDGTRTWIETFR